MQLKMVTTLISVVVVTLLWAGNKVADAKFNMKDCGGSSLKLNSFYAQPDFVKLAGKLVLSTNFQITHTIPNSVKVEVEARKKVREQK
jgi:hypothetical protein